MESEEELLFPSAVKQKQCIGEADEEEEEAEAEE